MTMLQWDQIGQRLYETGLDRGVLFLADGQAVVAWNGLTGVEENFGTDTTSPYYLDGVKYLDSVQIGDFSATIKALTYPAEWDYYLGTMQELPNAMVSGQQHHPFGLSYRTLIGDDTHGTNLGYKLHIVYGLMAVKEAPARNTISDTASALEFSWTVASVPQEISGYKPTGHVILDSRYIPAGLLSDVEAILYGTDDTFPILPSLSDLVALAQTWHLITIVDNGDGTWTATGPDDLISLDVSTQIFTIDHADAVYLDANTYTIQSSDEPMGD